jgi:DNA primase
MNGRDKENRMNCSLANALDLVSYLAHLGFRPAKTRGTTYWYLSPLRNEKTPSFKVNSKLNAWYDFGLGEGGKLVDFGIRFFACSISDFLKRMDAGEFSFPPQRRQAFLPVTGDVEVRLTVTAESPLSSPALLAYLASRNIALPVVRKYCRQLNFTLHNRSYYGIGFKNNSGGWDIRNAFQKYAASPKDFSLIQNGANRVLVFEGFLDFLSYKTHSAYVASSSFDYLVLNGIGLFERARPVIESYSYRGLYFDQDAAGRKVTAYALGLNAAYLDESGFYTGYKDVNDWLIKTQR